MSEESSSIFRLVIREGRGRRPSEGSMFSVTVSASDLPKGLYYNSGGFQVFPENALTFT